ncbi:MAG: bifunctional oligoribonuclease/PAP phosphatase NrnA [Bacteroidales bacterium]|nr:bifunctional oligoribonuclease/PAP phosphatase NrnA [Bacteroidales bacterium]
MALDWSPLVAWIRQHHSFLLMTHIRPDADGMGSQLALAEALRAIGKQARVVVASTIPPRYHFLDPDGTRIERYRPANPTFQEVDAVIILDTGTWNQLGDFGDFLRNSGKPNAVVDHHQTQDDLGGMACIDTSAEACGRLAYELIRALEAPINPEAANSLYMALATDTGWFRHSNTTAATFTLAAELVALGATPTPLYEKLYEDAPISRLRLTGKALERLQVCLDGQVAFTEVYLSDYADTGAVPGDTEDLINYPRSIQGVEVAVIFIEQPEGGTKISFRARSRVDVSAIAQQFAGGGHRLAAGARANGTLPDVKADVLRAIETALRV